MPAVQVHPAFVDQAVESAEVVHFKAAGAGAEVPGEVHGVLPCKTGWNRKRAGFIASAYFSTIVRCGSLAELGTGNPGSCPAGEGTRQDRIRGWINPIS
jgi:hypothetical protein